jgi:hypothetical protein
LPLVEDDGRGFFYHQEHVTPHSKSSVQLLDLESIIHEEMTHLT